MRASEFGPKRRTGLRDPALIRRELEASLARAHALVEHTRLLLLAHAIETRPSGNVRVASHGAWSTEERTGSGRAF